MLKLLDIADDCAGGRAHRRYSDPFVPHINADGSREREAHCDLNRNSVHTGIVAKPATNIHIPLSANEAIALIGRVKPDATMPRPGAQATKAKPKPKRGRKG
jgi:hypothetical protein